MKIQLRKNALLLFHSLFSVSAAAMLWCLPNTLLAGPPFTTDDPYLVEYRHWEVYLASQIAQDPTGWSGTAPEVEVNYGAAHNLQLHVIAPLAFVAPSQGAHTYGYGDTEAGVKFQFLKETYCSPSAAVFPLVELPSGNQDQGLGNGVTRIYLPLWLGDTVGPVTTYGGGGYWLNPGTDQQNYWFYGWALQYQLRDNLALGAETFHTTPATVNGQSETRFSLGAILDLSEHHHLLFSAGRDYQKPDSFQGYFAYQLTFGP